MRLCKKIVLLGRGKEVDLPSMPSNEALKRVVVWSLLGLLLANVFMIFLDDTHAYTHPLKSNLYQRNYKMTKKYSQKKK